MDGFSLPLCRFAALPLCRFAALPLCRFAEGRVILWWRGCRFPEMYEISDAGLAAEISCWDRRWACGGLRRA
jgi:hypothetical protein